MLPSEPRAREVGAWVSRRACGTERRGGARAGWAPRPRRGAADAVQRGLAPLLEPLRPLARVLGALLQLGGAPAQVLAPATGQAEGQRHQAQEGRDPRHAAGATRRRIPALSRAAGRWP